MTFHALGREAFAQVRAFYHELIELRLHHTKIMRRLRSQIFRQIVQ